MAKNKKFFVTEYENFDAIYDAVVEWVDNNVAFEDDIDKDNIEYMEYYDNWYYDEGEDDLYELKNGEDLKRWFTNEGWELDDAYTKKALIDTIDWNELYSLLRDLYDEAYDKNDIVYDFVLEAYLISPEDLDEFIVFSTFDIED